MLRQNDSTSPSVQGIDCAETWASESLTTGISQASRSTTAATCLRSAELRVGCGFGFGCG